MLLRREDRPVSATIEHLVGLQAQNPTDPYYALWSRLEGFAPDELARLLTERQAVRTWPMRRTVHLLTAQDARILLPLMQAVGERALLAGYRRQLEGLDLGEVAALSRKLLEEEPRIRPKLIPHLRERWPDHEPLILSYAATFLLPLVQLPPRGLWGRTGPAVLTTAEAWLGQPLDPDPSPDEVILRYLAAFGPASNADIRTWSGLTGVHEVTKRPEHQLRSFEDEDGRKLYDLPDAPLPDPDTPAPPRFLPEFDNIFLSHDRRNRIMGAAVRPATITVNTTVLKLLIDGFVDAEWTVASEDGRSTLTIRPYRPLTGVEQEAVIAEGERLLAFVAPGEVHDIRFTAPAPPAG